jgi:hypothetical protein
MILKMAIVGGWSAEREADSKAIFSEDTQRELENNSRQPENPTVKRQSDSVNKSQLTLSRGV